MLSNDALEAAAVAAEKWPKSGCMCSVHWFSIPGATHRWINGQATDEDIESG